VAFRGGTVAEVGLIAAAIVAVALMLRYLGLVRWAG